MISFVAILALVPFVVSQSVPVEGIEAHFDQADIVPTVIPDFLPEALLTINFAGVGDITPGQPLQQAQVQPVPSLTITPANSSVTLDGTYTIAMIDGGAVGNPDLAKGVTRHWLVNSATIDGTNVSTATASPITAYAGPAPPSGSGPHRYIILLLEQPSTFAAPQGLSAAGTPVALYDFNAYVKDSGLGAIVAGSYFTVEVGTASASIESTEAVVSSTLAGAGTTTSGASTTKGAGTGTTTSSTGTATQTPKGNGAFGLTSNMIFVVAAALVVLV